MKRGCRLETGERGHQVSVARENVPGDNILLPDKNSQREMDQWVKGPVAKNDQLSLIPGTHVVEGGKSHTLSSDLNIPWHVHSHTHT